MKAYLYSKGYTSVITHSIKELLRECEIIEMTDLPIEPLVYTKEEFEEMKKSNPFIKDILRDSKKLV